MWVSICELVHQECCELVKIRLAVQPLGVNPS